MIVKCFNCDALIEAPDTDAVVAAFLTHGYTAHSWSHPEEALRNYAHNYIEAIERVNKNSERLSEISKISVIQVTKDNVEEWLKFFDHDAFAGNPDWASCYCLEPHVPATPELPERAWRTTRASMADRFRAGKTFGYLAYAGDKPAGWVNASLRSDYGLFKLVDPAGPDPSLVIGISCFVVAPPYRRHGIAAALLDQVIAKASGRGAAWIEAYPHHAPEPGDPGHFRGPRSMFDARGFRAVEVKESYTVMRRAVG